MESRWERIVTFGESVLHLDSLQLFAAYLLMILLSGTWQRYTRPLNLKLVLVIYNFVCVVLSIYTLTGFGRCLATTSNIYLKEGTHDLKNIFFWYWVTKIIELLDTVFMVLRHKHRQISFLHVYHHSSMLLLSDYAYHHAPWAAIAVILAINALVHVILYSYYGLTVVFPNNPPAWKKQLTQLQIFQFCIDFIYAGIGYMYHGFCIYGLLYGVAMTCLFCNFYYRAYIKPGSSQKNSTEENQNGYLHNKNDKVQKAKCA